MSQTSMNSSRSDSGIDDKHALEQLFANYRLYAEVKLQNRNLNDNHVKMIVEHIIKNKRCIKIWLNDNRISSSGAKMIANALNDTIHLRELYLDGNQLSDEGVYFLAKELQIEQDETSFFCCKSRQKITAKAPIERLSLANNLITDAGISHLVKMLPRNQQLTHLWLNDNEISDVGVKLLADTLQSCKSNLQFLYLHRNLRVTGKCVDNLVRLLKKETALRALCLSECGLSRLDADKLSDACRVKDELRLSIDLIPR